MFFNLAPVFENGINDNNNGTVDNRAWRKRTSRISALLYAEVKGQWRDSYYNHKDTTNDTDDNEYVAWEPV